MAGDMNDAVAGVRDLMLGVFRFTHVSWLGRTSLVLVLFMAGAAHGEPPLALTEGKPVSLRILAAKLRAGGTYPPMPECVAPGARCLDPPPFWLKAQVLATVHGDPVPSDIEVSGAEHFGMRGYAGLDQPVLLLVRTDGLHYEMARNSRVALLRHKSGALYVPAGNLEYMPWLPCDVAQIAETMLTAEFGRKAQRDAAKSGKREYVVSLAGLRAFLHKKEEASLPLACR
ncbi:hypothetical protein LP419_25225 [Massilia sp. H-1]|nr:hypothetical protein LP419_25225 [Massilia sp. H-1]